MGTRRLAYLHYVQNWPANAGCRPERRLDYRIVTYHSPAIANDILAPDRNRLRPDRSFRCPNYTSHPRSSRTNCPRSDRKSCLRSSCRSCLRSSKSYRRSDKASRPGRWKCRNCHPHCRRHSRNFRPDMSCLLGLVNNPAANSRRYLPGYSRHLPAGCSRHSLAGRSRRCSPDTIRLDLADSWSGIRHFLADSRRHRRCLADSRRHRRCPAGRRRHPKRRRPLGSGRIPALCCPACSGAFCPVKEQESVSEWSRGRGITLLAKNRKRQRGCIMNGWQ